VNGTMCCIRSLFQRNSTRCPPVPAEYTKSSVTASVTVARHPWHDRVRLICRAGHDRAQRLPLIVSVALKLPQESFVLDGAVIVLRPDGISDFDALAPRKHDTHPLFYAFDMLAGWEDIPRAAAFHSQSQPRTASFGPG
jgi:hypothetical protein